MKRNHLMKAALITVGLLAVIATQAQNMPATNRLTFSSRFGLNISTKFSGVAPVAAPAMTRTTPNGSTYNYDDGYVLPDVSGSGDGYTWNWGYDNSARQLIEANNTILMGRSSGTANLRAPSETDEPSVGAELTYTHEIGANKKFRYGFEASVNYLNITVRTHNSYALRGTRITDAFAYFGGATPPGATPDSPYQGTFDGPGFVIGTTPVNSTTIEGAVVGNVAGQRRFDADLWGGRLGPYLEYHPNDNFCLSLSGGLAVGMIDDSASWDETITFTSGSLQHDVGRGSDRAWLWGGYVSVNVFLTLNEHWSAAGSVQYQNLGTYDHNFGGRKVEVDLGKSLFFSIGVSYEF